MFSKYRNTCTEQTSNWTDPRSFCITRALDVQKKKTEERLGYDYYDTTTEVCDTSYLFVVLGLLVCHNINCDQKVYNCFFL